MISFFSQLLLVLAILYSQHSFAQPYDTISFPHPYEHEAQIGLLDGKLYKGPLVDTKDSSVIISAINKNDSIFEIQAKDIEFIKVFRSDFERHSTSGLIVLAAGGTAFFTTLNYWQNRKDELRFENSEWLISGLATLVVMPLAGLISNAVYLYPRENYIISGSQAEFNKVFNELKAYSFWTYLTAKRDES